MAGAYTCEAGKDCVGVQVLSDAPLRCSSGMACPGGNFTMSWCPEGSYCPLSLGRPLECTKGSFCPDAMAEPIPCPVASQCPAGARIYSQYLYILIAAPFVLATFVLLARTLLAAAGRTLFCRRVRHDVRPGPSARGAGAAGGGAGEVAVAVSDLGTDLAALAEPAAPRALHVRFERLSVAVRGERGRETLVLRDVSGDFKPGQVTAVMGASGAGKTTLVNVLLGKLAHSKGRVLVNGAEERMARFARLVGFVPQDDVLLRALTVRETLEHAAATRLPRGATRAQRAAVVDRALETLQLASLASRLVGDELRRGLSRSERKRLNIGVELVAEPRLLFVDEPTTGLDARTSHELVEALGRIAGAGVTVVAVLHQPRYEILQMCSEVLLLGKGGFVAFQGRPDRALHYFQELGYRLEEGMNPADLFLDVLNCRAMREAAPPAALPPLSGRHLPIPSPSFRSSRHSLRLPPLGSSPALAGAGEAAGEAAGGAGGAGGELLPTTLEFLEAAARAHGVTLDPGDAPAPGEAAERERAAAAPPAGRCGSGASGGAAWRAGRACWRGRGGRCGATGGPRCGAPRASGGSSPLLRPGRAEHAARPVYLVLGIVSMLLAGSSMAAGFNGRVRYLPRLPAAVVAVCPMAVRERCATEAALGIIPTTSSVPPAPPLSLRPPARPHRPHPLLLLLLLLSPQGFYLTMILGAICAVAAVPSFANDRPLYYREVAAGCSAPAFFVAKCAFDVINVFVRAFVFCAFFVLMIGAPGGFWPWLGIVFPLCWCAYGVGYIAACVLPKERASIVAAVAGVASVITSGLSPSLAQVKDRYGPMQVLWWVSFNRWSAEGMVILALSEYRARGFDVAGPLATQGYELDNYWLDVLVPLLLGVSHRLVAFLCLRYRHREKQR
eukprot:tig00020556_g11057.t1